jgi:2-amino-4-hydroxy-6-hydroxymethyldihydropteridine diphosphokinase
VNERWKERLIDIDIIYYHDLVVRLPHLIIPHEEIPNRLFTLIPLCELIPDFIHPVLQVSNQLLLDTCTDALIVRKIN